MVIPVAPGDDPDQELGLRLGVRLDGQSLRPRSLSRMCSPLVSKAKTFFAFHARKSG